MKSLWIISELFPPDETSTAFILGEIANVMAQKYEVKVISGSEIYDKRKKIDPNNTFVLNPQVEVIHVKGVNLDKNTFFGKAMRFAVISWQLYKTAKKEIRDGDKVLLVTNPAPVVVFISWLKKIRNFELNVLVHDIFPENTKAAGINLPIWFYKFLKNLFDIAYSRADQLIVLGRDMKQVLEKKMVRQTRHPKISIIGNWADLDIVSPIEVEYNSQKFILEYAGNIGRLQGLDSFFENIKKAKNSCLEIHLWGTGAAEGCLKHYANSNGIDNIIFHGAYLRSKQSEVINRCDMALVTLSKGMYGLGVPSKTYNIMAAGKAVLFIGEPESEIGILVREKQIGYVFHPEDNKRIVEFLSSLTPERIPEFKEMGKRARKVAETEYAKGIILNKFVESV